MEKHSRAVSEMYSRFKGREARPPEKYIGRSVNLYGDKLEAVGYSHKQFTDEPLLTADASQNVARSAPEPFDVAFKGRETYRYAGINDLMG